MKPAVYELMVRIENRHWWYCGLRRMVAQHWAAAAPPGPLQVLDVGCGTGAMLKMLDRRARAFGIDCSPVAIDTCRRARLVRTAVASALNLPFPDASFDAVVSCDVLCHEAVTDRAAALREMARVLKPGGILLLNLPAYPWLLSSHDHAVANNRRFTRGEVVTLLRDQALTTLKATYWNSFLFPPIAAIRLWRKFRPIPESDLAATPAPWLNGTLSWLLALEAAVIRRVPLPFGLSLFTVARKDSHTPTPS